MQTFNCVVAQIFEQPGGPPDTYIRELFILRGRLSILQQPRFNLHKKEIFFKRSYQTMKLIFTKSGEVHDLKNVRAFYGNIFKLKVFSRFSMSMDYKLLMWLLYGKVKGG